jgi:hypothetical protein
MKYAPAQNLSFLGDAIYLCANVIGEYHWLDVVKMSGTAMFNLLPIGSIEV